MRVEKYICDRCEEDIIVDTGAMMGATVKASGCEYTATSINGFRMEKHLCDKCWKKVELVLRGKK